MKINMRTTIRNAVAMEAGRVQVDIAQAGDLISAFCEAVVSAAAGGDGYLENITPRGGDINGAICPAIISTALARAKRNGGWGLPSKGAQPKHLPGRKVSKRRAK